MPDEIKTDKGAEGAAASGIDADEITKLVNAAVSSQLKRVPFAKMIKDAIATAMPARTDEGEGADGDPEAAAKAASAKKAAAGPGAAGAASEAAKVTDDGMAKELADMRKLLDRQAADMKEAKKQAAFERRRASDEKGFASVRSALAAKGIADGPALNAAVDILRSRGQLIIDDEGGVKMKLRAEFDRGLGEEERELALGDAIPHYLKSPEAALFMPPPARTASPRLAPAKVASQAGASGARQSQNPLAEILTAAAEAAGGGKSVNDLLF